MTEKQHHEDARSEPGGSTRRRVLAVGGASLSAIVLGAATPRIADAAERDRSWHPEPPMTPSCVLTPEVLEGPYYLDTGAVRADITEGKPGVPLHLRLRLLDATSCAPIAHAAVDIWQCDAMGSYSGYASLGNELPPSVPGHIEPTDGERFLRGVQLTDGRGIARFRTIYPGWYEGRPIHIHLKVHIGGQARGRRYSGGHVAHTGQLYFPETVTRQIALLPPYSDNTLPRVRPEDDPIYLRQGGSGSVMSLAPVRSGLPERGFVATLAVGVDPDATPPPADFPVNPTSTA